MSGNVPPSSAPDLCFELFGQTCHFCLHIGDHHFGRGTNKVNKTHPDFECLMSLALQREKQKNYGRLWGPPAWTCMDDFQVFKFPKISAKFSSKNGFPKTIGETLSFRWKFFQCSKKLVCKFRCSWIQMQKDFLGLSLLKVLIHMTLRVQTKSGGVYRNS